MFLAGLHSAGRFFSAETPVPPGPRHCGQLAAPAVLVKATTDERRMMTRISFISEEVFMSEFPWFNKLRSSGQS
jgi:hypothetical protein